MKNRIAVIICMAAVWGCGQAVYGQATASPHSLFGLGEVNTGNFGENSGMAGVGIGFMNPNIPSLNTLNPAGNAYIPQKTFIFDGSFYGKLAWYEGQGKKVYSGTGNISRLAFGFRAGQPWTISVGLTPYSAVGYDIRKDSPIEGTSQSYETKFTGEGGFNKLYISQAFNITPKLSAGINASLIFGTIRHKETSSYWYAERKSRGEKVYFDFGLQYFEQLNQNHFLTVGAIYGYKSYVKMTNSRYAYDFQGNMAFNEVTPTTRQNLPEFYGIGASISSRRTIWAIDYLYQGWSRVETERNIRYKDMNKLMVGFSYIPNPMDARRYLQTVKYQLGVSVNDSYLEMGNQSKMNYSVTGGLVFPMRNANTIHFNVEYGKNGFTGGNRNAVREDFLKVTFGFSFKEAWFIKYRYD